MCVENEGIQYIYSVELLLHGRYMQMKILVWGAGNNGKMYRQYIEQCTKDEFVGFIDNNSQRGG